MWQRIKTFFARVQTMSVKAMWMMIQKIHAESHVSRLFILCDMVWCAVHLYPRKKTENLYDHAG